MMRAIASLILLALAGCANLADEYEPLPEQGKCSDAEVRMGICKRIEVRGLIVKNPLIERPTRKEPT